MKNQGAQGFPCQIFSHVGHCYQITMKVAAFGCVNKQQLLRNFLWLSPQQHFRTLFREANLHANFRKAVIEISLFPAIFRSNIRGAFLTVAQIFVLTETIGTLSTDVFEPRTSTEVVFFPLWSILSQSRL